MSADGRLPEDIAAEQAYLAELRGQRESAAREETAARRASLAAQGLLPPEAAAEPPPAPARAPAAIPPLAANAAPAVSVEALLGLRPEVVAQLPAEVREMVEMARAERARQAIAAGLASPAEAAALGPAPQDAQTWLDGAETSADPAVGEAELEQREREILLQVEAELTDARPRGGGRFDIAPVRMLDNLLGMLFGRRNTW